MGNQVKDLMEKVKILVMFARPDKGVILDGQGPAIKEELELGNTDPDLFWQIEHTPARGLWVWEGRATWIDDEDGIGQYEFIHGDWREPDSREWRHLIRTNALELPEDPIDLNSQREV